MKGIHVVSPNKPQRAYTLKVLEEPQMTSENAPTCAQGIHVVSPNKRLTAGPLDNYLAVKQLQQEKKAHYMYEVGPKIPGRYPDDAGSVPAKRYIPCAHVESMYCARWVNACDVHMRGRRYALLLV